MVKYIWDAMSSITTDSPIFYHSKHLKTIDAKKLHNLVNDQSSASRRLLKLHELKKPELALPAQKDQFISIFENGYKPTHYLLFQLMDDGHLSIKQRYAYCERILSLESVIDEEGKTKSDTRAIRNCFAHPDRIDYYDHYHISLSKEVSLDLNADDISRLTAVMFDKCTLAQMLSSLCLNLILYMKEYESNTIIHLNPCRSC